MYIKESNEIVIIIKWWSLYYMNIRNGAVYKRTFILDEMSIFLAFFSAILIRYEAIINWVDYNSGIYIALFVTGMVFEFIVYTVYDLNKPCITLMDPFENFVSLILGRAILIVLSLVYFFFTQKTVLASRTMITLYFLLSILFGYILRMMYRKFSISRHGVKDGAKSYLIELSHVTDISNEYIDNIVNIYNEEEYDNVVVNVFGNDEDLVDNVIKKLEDKGIRTYVTISGWEYQVRPGIISDYAGFATIPAFVRREKCNVLGVLFSVARLEEAVFHVLRHLDALKGKYICFSNVHTTVMAKENDKYKKALNNAAFVFPDGNPIAKIQKRNGFEAAERIAGPDFMDNIFRDTENTSVSHYFYGSTEKTLKELEQKLKEKYPGLDIRGMYSPPFRALSKEEDEEDVKRINDSGADIIWIGLGAPKQEKWMSAHKGMVNGIMMGVGAGFDFHAGTIQRAPIWVQKIGLEWLYRLLKDPVRLFNRYFVTNAKFLVYVLLNRKEIGEKVFDLNVK